MKRDFLKKLGLEDEIINQIMKEYGTSVQSLNETIETLRESQTTLQGTITEKDKENATLKSDLSTANKKIKDFEKVDIDALRTSIKDWEDKYNAREYDITVDQYMNGYKFTSDLAKKAAVLEFKNQKFKLKDGKLDGADEFMKKFMEENESAFVKDEPKKEPEEQGQGTESKNAFQPYSYKPSGGGNNDDIKSFESMLDNIAKM